MADVIHFDPDQALDAMLDVFWKQGFKTTTTRELAEHSGLSESSLFNTFGTKREVYLACMLRYRESMTKFARRLEQSDSPLDGLREYWQFMCDYAADRSRPNGCFFTNATIEHAGDADITKLVKQSHRDSERVFRKTLDRAIELGELSPEADTRALAQFLVHSTQGIRVMGRLNPSKEKMQNIAATTMSVLDPYRL